MDALIESLKAEPALAWKLAVNVQGHAPDSAAAKKAAKIVKESELVHACSRAPAGRAHPPPRLHQVEWRTLDPLPSGGPGLPARGRVPAPDDGSDLRGMVE